MVAQQERDAIADKFAAAMAGIAAELAAEPRWRAYADYLELRGNRRHEGARQAAGSFAEVAAHWPYEERKRFSLWLMNRTGHVMEQIGGARNSPGGRSFVSPPVVIETVLLPTLQEWREREPGNPEPLFWTGLYSAFSPDAERPTAAWLSGALRLDPAHAPAREALARLILDAVAYNQHELPSGYLRDTPEDDLAALREAGRLLDETVDPGIRDSLGERIATLRNAALAWMERCGAQARAMPKDHGGGATPRGE